jgi:hypothetical protein
MQQIFLETAVIAGSYAKKPEESPNQFTQPREREQ